MIEALNSSPIMRAGIDPASAPNKPPLPPIDHLCLIELGVAVERNAVIRLRDGVSIYCDVYRPVGPAGEADLPALLSWRPYGKHACSFLVFWLLFGVVFVWFLLLL